MTLRVTASQLVGPTASGNKDFTAAGYRPKAMLFLTGNNASNNTTAGCDLSLGFVTGVAANAQVAASYNSQDNVATTATVRAIANAAHINTADFAGTGGNLKAGLTILGNGEFRANWNNADTASALTNCLALGGADIQFAQAGQFTTTTVTGDQVIKGVGFKPDLVIFCLTISASNTTSKNTTQFGFGAMDAAGNQWSISQRSRDSLATSDTDRAYSNVACINLTQTAADNFTQKSTFVSMNADGFTINHGTSAGLAMFTNFLAIKGGRWKVGTDTQKTSTGTQPTTGVGFQPTGVIFGTVCDTATDAIATSARFGMGWTDGTNQSAIFTGDTDNISPTVCNTTQSNSACLIMATEGASATPTINASAAISSFDVDGYTLNWGTADATARTFGYIAFGSTSTAEVGLISKSRLKPRPFAPGVAR